MRTILEVAALLTVVLLGVIWFRLRRRSARRPEFLYEYILSASGKWRARTPDHYFSESGHWRLKSVPHRLISAMFLGLIFLTTSADAGSLTGQMRVSVQVIGRTILSIDRQVEAIEITEADIARGYVDVRDGIAFHVRSNAADGYAIHFESIGHPFVRAEVTLEDRVVTIVSDSAWVPFLRQQGTTRGVLAVRLSLAPSIATGRYRFPIRIHANAF
jgi:hypothetical protein